MLPVAQISQQLVGSLSEHNVILSAPPGAGKSTYLPLVLLNAAWLKDKKIVMLQPRRVAVRAIAGYLAQQLGEPVGQTVGYRIRGESKVSAATRLEIVTEGLLTRILQQDPELSGIGLVIFDEFHERSLHADFALALCLEVQGALREDLRLLVMSATLDELGLAQLLPTARHLETHGRSYPVEMRYQAISPQVDLVKAMVGVIHNALKEEQGSLLAFLPGAGEIRRLAEILQPKLAANIHLYCLYGELGKEAQMAAVAPLKEGERKVVLATNIAETSLTIEGISLVVDSGMEKVANYDLNRDITQLLTQRISKASATQRAGRAGRLGPGICYRLWSEESHHRLAAQAQPQILTADIAPLVLEAAAWGAPMEQLALLDKPTEAQLTQAKGLLYALEALDTDDKITAIGTKMCSLGCHPRLAHMLLKAKEMSEEVASLGCLLAALMEGKNPLRQGGADIQLRISFLQNRPQDPLWQVAAIWAKRLQVALCKRVDTSPLALLLAMAYPDRIAKSRGSGRYLLANGAGAALDSQDPLQSQDYLVVADLIKTSASDARISLAIGVDPDSLKPRMPHLFSEEMTSSWDESAQRMQVRRLHRLGCIVLRSEVLPAVQGETLISMWRSLIETKGLDWLPFGDKVQQLLQRMRLAAQLFPQEPWPAMSEAALLQGMEEWLLPYLENARSYADLQKIDFYSLLRNRLDWPLQQRLDAELPTKLTVPSGQSHTLEYQPDGTVQLSVRMQEMYGLAHTPHLAGGRIKVLIELLSPAHRPLQKTADLAGFWAGSYKEVQKEMKGRYPKHFWPDNPAQAQATTRTKKAM
ncbi:ATP-dependent helicase HrpB [Aliiglaciecola sp. CAU 1673]|uniref:ATP-dependent helicase HrpB n=1 Tax=Aliiglaciecola sp. CAU 1673 TaxID=3032595 RepID=UPI0031F34A47